MAPTVVCFGDEQGSPSSRARPTISTAPKLRPLRQLSLHSARPNEETRYDEDRNLLPPMTPGRVVAQLDGGCSTGAEVEETHGVRRK